ncbi:hypothetical protein EDC96DRAFT_571657 [Choanephora cucurbitarum]|nr:hypothetical protein EDC96DRAFT_571657 [Choanephora cucurbitarum]
MNNIVFEDGLRNKHEIQGNEVMKLKMKADKDMYLAKYITDSNSYTSLKPQEKPANERTKASAEPTHVAKRTKQASTTKLIHPRSQQQHQLLQQEISALSFKGAIRSTTGYPYGGEQEKSWGCSLHLPNGQTKTTFGHWDHQKTEMKKQLDVDTRDLSTDPTNIQLERREFVCGQTDSPTAKIRVLVSATEGPMGRRLDPALESVQSPILKSSLTPYSPMSKKYQGETLLGNLDNSLTRATFFSHHLTAYGPPCGNYPQPAHLVWSTPVCLRRKSIDLRPTFDHLTSIDSRTLKLSVLQPKLAFILGVV